MSTLSTPDILMKGLYDKRCVALLYDGLVRMVEPYTIGISRAGNPVVRGWQVNGASKSGQRTGWNLFEIHRISDAVVTDTIFQPSRPGYNSGDKGMTQIHHTI